MTVANDTVCLTRVTEDLGLLELSVGGTLPVLIDLVKTRDGGEGALEVAPLLPTLLIVYNDMVAMPLLGKTRHI